MEEDFEFAPLYLLVVIWLQLPSITNIGQEPSVGSFSDNVGLRAIIFSRNVGSKTCCYRAGRLMFSGNYN
jgi:hypothetical protein